MTPPRKTTNLKAKMGRKAKSSMDPEDLIEFEIDLNAVESANISFPHMLYARLCGSSSCTFCKKHGQPEVAMPPVSALLRGLAKNCSKDPDFLDNNMTLGEIIFRLLIKNNNAPITIAQMEADIIEAGGELVHLRNTARKNILGSLKEPNEYFIRQVPTTAA